MGNQGRPSKNTSAKALLISSMNTLAEGQADEIFDNLFYGLCHDLGMFTQPDTGNQKEDYRHVYRYQGKPSILPVTLQLYLFHSSTSKIFGLNEKE